MRVTWFPRVSRFGQFSVIGLVLVLGWLLVPPTSAVAQEAAKPTLTFNGDAGVMLLYVKADKAADFEAIMAKLKEALAKSDVPEVKQQAASLKLFRTPAPTSPDAPVMYMLIADPAVKNIEYAFLPILYKAFPAEAKAFSDKWAEVKHAQPPTVFRDLTLVMRMQ